MRTNIEEVAVADWQHVGRRDFLFPLSAFPGVLVKSPGVCVWIFPFDGTEGFGPGVKFLLRLLVFA